jgi:hypothetical protein
MEFDKAIQSKKVRRGVEVVVAVLVLLVVFGAGVFVGLEKARFSYRWGENYFRSFAGPRPFSADRGYMNAHGSAGQILKIDGNTVAIKEIDGQEKNILVNNQTSIKIGPHSAGLADLKPDDSIVVFGSPDNQGQITAKLIRILPTPPPNGTMP